jgi:26S proteasome regulatory subunit N5
MSGEIIKADRDFTKEVDAALPDAEKEAQNGQVQAAVEKLLALEKQTRQSSDLASTSRVIVAIVTICKDSGDWSLLNEQVQVLSKKHGQLKQAITKMVQVVMGFLDDAPNLDVKLSVIETLRTVTEGKVWVKNMHRNQAQMLTLV